MTRYIRLLNQRSYITKEGREIFYEDLGFSFILHEPREEIKSDQSLEGQVCSDCKEGRVFLTIPNLDATGVSATCSTCHGTGVRKMI